MGMTIIFSLSYNILFGQTGLLSFGHAVYYGFGAYLTVHAVKIATAGGLPLPAPLMPLVGGLAGLAIAALFGWVSTKRAGTAFAMISLGFAELFAALSLIMRGFFGGEEGITINRTKLFSFLGYNFGPQVQVYYLIAFWCFVCIVLMYALTRTPLGRMMNAVRENPERVQFIGYDTHIIRFVAFCFSGFFAGIAGALAALNFEIANSALFGAAQSGLVLLSTFIGGAGIFIGPIIGAILVTWLQVMLSDLTGLWQLYFGILFVSVVMFAPTGLAGLIMMHRPFWQSGELFSLVPAYLRAGTALVVMLLGCILFIELVEHITIKASEGGIMKLRGYAIDARTILPWVVAVALAGIGLCLFRATRGGVSAALDRARAAARAKGYSA
jgi:branched-chain amino acid transport system permease protein